MIDYEKKYKEALEKARKKYEIYESVNDVGHCEALESIFPELAESEDERIREELLNAFKEATDSLYMVLTPSKREAFIAWLETQGEKKSIESTKNKLNESMIKPDPNPYWTLAPEYKLMNEQKPAWSEEDERILNTVIHNLRYPGVNYYKKPIEEEVKWLKSLKDRIQPQPKQEWSKEDKGTINNLIDYLENELDSSYTDLDKESFAKEIKLLKSLRLQNRWKPSEEQMEILCKVSTYGVLASSVRDVLQSLYNDLKKL